MKIRIYLLLPVFLSLQARSQDLSAIGDQKPFAVSGSLDIRTIGYSAHGIDPRRSPFSYIISGSPVFSFYGLTVPVSFSFSEQDRSFSQPFNQYGLSPTWKWITLHGGYRNVSFSPYTLAGHTLLGGGFELRPGKFRAGFMTGRLNRSTAIDTLSGYVRPESFNRYGTAGRLGYESKGSFVNLSFIAAKDTEKGFKGNLDSANVSPESNLVLGADFKYTVVKSLYIYGDGAVSIYTKNIRSDLEIDIDSTQKTLLKLSRYLQINGTSEYSLAYSGGLGYTHKYFALKAGYKLVEPNFRSMGAYFFQNDLQNITISPSFNALKGRLRFSGSIGIQEDNRKGLKLASTKRVISMANVSWDLSDQLGIDANFTNFTANSEPTVAMVENRYLLAQTNRNLSVTPRLILPGTDMTHVVILSYNASSLKDLNEDTVNENDIFSSVAFLNYSLTLNQAGLNLNTGLNYVNNKLSIGNTGSYGASLGAGMGFLKNKLSVNTHNSWTRSDMAENARGTILNFSLSTSYMPLKGHRVALRVSYMSNAVSREDQDTNKYNELTGELGYTFSF